jgi:lysophospholipase L1-like esterase
MTGTSQPTSRRLWLAMVAVTVIGCLVIALLAEAGVRVRHWLKYGDLWGVEETFALDPATGLRVPVKNSRTGPIVINSRGFRSPEIVVPKPAGTVRIAFLGGSTTYCSEVSSNEHTWPHLVWSAIQAQWSDATIDYVNAGVPGYTLSSLRSSLKARVAPLDPDILVIYEATNDLTGNSFDLAARQGLVREHTEESLSWLSDYSLLWYLLEKNLLVWQRQAESDAVTGLLKVDPAVLAAPFRTDLEALVREGQEVTLLVVLVTFSQRLRPGQTEEERRAAAITSRYYMPYMSSDQALAGFDAYNAVIREVAAQTGALLVEGEETILADAAHFTDSVHFTDLGSEAQAARVIRALLASDRIAELITTRSGGAP